MKISVDDEVLFTIEEHQKNAIMNDIEADFESDMKRRIKWVIDHKYEQCLLRMKKEWEPKLKDRDLAIPKSDADLVDMILAQPDYKNRIAREAEAFVMSPV